MGSQNSDGSRISQARNSIRQLGKGFTSSADRVETRTNVEGSGVLGPQLTVADYQISTQKAYEAVKVTRSSNDSTVQLIYNSGLADL